MLLQHQDIIFRAVFGTLIGTNFAGNILVCLVVRRFLFMKTPMNYLLVHLAVCDMLVGLFMFPRHILYGLYEHPDGLKGDLLCKFFTYGNMAWLPSCVSVFTLVVIAWERYTAVMKPFESRVSKTYLKYAIVVCWLLGVLICMPETVVIGFNSTINDTSCDLIWIHDWGGIFDSALWLFAVGYVPFLIIFFLYGRVVHTLWFPSHGNTVNDVSQRSLQLSRKGITKTAVIVTIVLFLCYMPNLIYYFLVSISPSSKSTSVAESLKSASPVFYPVSHLLILTNSSINPFIYALRSKRFRKCIRTLLCVRRKVSPVLRRRTFPLAKRSIPNGLPQSTIRI